MTIFYLFRSCVSVWRRFHLIGLCCSVNSRLLKNTPDTLLPLIDTALHTGQTITICVVSQIGVSPLLAQGQSSEPVCAVVCLFTVSNHAHRGLILSYKTTADIWIIPCSWPMYILNCPMAGNYEIHSLNTCHDILVSPVTLHSAKSGGGRVWELVLQQVWHIPRH